MRIFLKAFAWLSFVVSFLWGETTCSWIDPPAANYLEILETNDEQVNELSKLFQDYHQIPKHLKDRLANRIQALAKIDAFLVEMLKDNNYRNKTSTLTLLRTMVLQKQEYLIQLSNLPSPKEIETYHLGAYLNKDSVYTPIFLRNNLTYSLKMKEFWGRFWLETIDPCHRRLANYYQYWLSNSPQSADDLAFFLWLELQPIPKYIPIVFYFSKKEAESYRITILQGYLRNKDSELLTTPEEKKNLFIIDLDKELFVAPWGQEIWHTSLTRGMPVLGAGLIHVESGIIKRINFESGHYLPDLRQSYQALQILIEKGAIFDKTIEIIYFENRNKYKALISYKLLDTYELFDEAIHSPFNRSMISSNEF